jgi:CBS domain containing-hemolysin-like protein
MLIGICITLLTALVTLSSVASYLRLLMRRLTPVASRKLFQANEGRRIQADRERVGVSISALHGAAMALFATGLMALLCTVRPAHAFENLGTALLIVLGVVAVCDQLIPFVLVARHDEPEVILEQWMPLLRVGVFLALPLTFPILISTTINRLLEPMEPRLEVAIPQEDKLQELIEVGEQEGLLREEQGELLQSVVEFGESVVRELMTPRPEIDAIEISASIEELRALFRERRHSRVIVYSGQFDHVEGIANVRDLTELPPEEQAKVTIASLVRPVLFVPETKRSSELLKELQQSTSQIAVVVDEYGSVSGVVTIEDLLEEIVGDIRDEVESHQHDIIKESPSSYIVAGQTDLAEMAEELHVEVEGRDYSTVAGLVLAQLGHVPAPGENFQKNGLSFEVLEANRRTVQKVRVTIRANGASPQPETASS